MTTKTGNSKDDKQLGAIEAHLAGMLKPVSPSREVVQRLRGRIRFPRRSELVVRLRDWQRLMLVLGGVISGALVMLTVARALFHIVGRRDAG
jgi:hypothetical protein